VERLPAWTSTTWVPTLRHGTAGHQPGRRSAERYANDQGHKTSLVAVTARSNRSNVDQDPAQWLSPAADAHCRYTAEWVGTKLRWSLTTDETELTALRELADACPLQTVKYQLAP
jgi:hypothetical protein